MGRIDNPPFFIAPLAKVSTTTLFVSLSTYVMITLAQDKDRRTILDADREARKPLHLPDTARQGLCGAHLPRTCPWREGVREA